MPPQRAVLPKNDLLTTLVGPALVLALCACALSACGSPLPPVPERDSGPDGGRDGGGAAEDASIDSGAPEDTGPPVDGAIDGGGAEVDATIDGDVVDAPPGDDGGVTFLDGCVPPVCPTPPAGCSYTASSSCTCGMLVCPAACGGGAACGATDYCDYTTAFTCTGAGSCMTRPAEDSCPTTFSPVCGCNGATFMNECDAHLNGVDVAFDGMCPAVTDCRSMGCLIGQRCLGCPGTDGRTSYICLPDGVSCT